MNSLIQFGISVMGIYEVSFKTQRPLPPIAARRDRLKVLRSTHPDTVSALRQLINRCKFRLNRWLAFDTYQSALICEADLSWQTISGAMSKILDEEDSDLDLDCVGSENLNLADPSCHPLLFQLANYAFCEHFQQVYASQNYDKKLINAYRKRIYSPKREDFQIIQNLAEVRRYLTFDFQCDRDQHLILVLDFANEYRSLQTIDQLGLRNLKHKHRLIQRYDGKGCEWVGVAPVAIGQPLPELGNQSLIEYHQQQGNLRYLQTPLDPNSPAVEVRYGEQRQTCYHLPQLLQTIYDRSELNPKDLERLILPIQDRIKKANKTSEAFNKSSFLTKLEAQFISNPRQPHQITNFRQGEKAKNLDFGAQNFYEEAWRGYKDKHSLEKPQKIATLVLYPQAWEGEMKQYMLRLRQKFDEFKISLAPIAQSRAYNPQDAVNLQRVCQNLPENCDFVFAFVPTRNEPGFDEQANPYNTFKQELFNYPMPSQMVTYKTMTDPYSKSINAKHQNIVFGILAKLGYLPWRLRSMPGTAQAFVGLDLGRKGEQTVGASAFVVDRYGQQIGWSSVSLQRGETFDARSLRSILFDLFTDFEQQTGEPLRHLVVHRDGTVKNSEMQTLREIETDLRRNGLQAFDVVEIVKDTIVRAAMWNTNEQQWKNPPRGWGWEHAPNEAIVLTTGEKQAKISKNAAPQPLLVRHRYGETDLMTIAEQVYWLSEMHVGSTQTVRLPVTTYYADKIAEVTLRGLLPPNVHRERRLYFI